MTSALIRGSKIMPFQQGKGFARELCAGGVFHGFNLCLESGPALSRLLLATFGPFHAHCCWVIPMPQAEALPADPLDINLLEEEVAPLKDNELRSKRLPSGATCQRR